jgi:hypothetical protein
VWAVMSLPINLLKYREVMQAPFPRSEESISCILLKDFAIFLFCKLIYVQQYSKECMDIPILQENFVSICKLSSDGNSIFALSESGTISIITCCNDMTTQSVNITVNSIIFPQELLFLNIIMNEHDGKYNILMDFDYHSGIMWFYSLTHLLIVQLQSQVDLFDKTGSDVNASILYSGNVYIPEGFVPTCGVWSFESQCHFVYSCCDISIYVLSFATDGTGSGEFCIIDTVSHVGWISSFSLCDTCSSEVVFSGDSTGHVVMWGLSCGSNGDVADSITPFFVSSDVCDYRPVAALLYDAICRILWIADRGGNLVCCQVSNKLHSFHKLRTVRMPCAIGGIPALLWTSVRSSGEPDSKRQLEGTLRCYLAPSGAVIEIYLCSSIRDVFRAQPVLPRLQTSSSAVLDYKYRSVSHVKVCALLVDSNILAVAGGNFVHLWDISSGALLHSIATDSGSAVSALATTVDIAASASHNLTNFLGRLAICYYNGKVDVIALSAGLDTASSSAIDLHGGGDDNAAAAPSSYDDSSSVHQSLSSSYRDNDLIEIVSTEASEASSVKYLPTTVSVDGSHSHVLSAKVSSSEYMDGSVSSSRKTISSTSIASVILAALPISDAFFSSLGNYIGLCYIRKRLILYNLESRQQVCVFSYDQGLVDIYSVFVSSRVEQESLILSVLTRKGEIDLINALEAFGVKNAISTRESKSGVGKRRPPKAKVMDRTSAEDRRTEIVTTAATTATTSNAAVKTDSKRVFQLAELSDEPINGSVLWMGCGSITDAAAVSSGLVISGLRGISVLSRVHNHPDLILLKTDRSCDSINSINIPYSELDTCFCRYQSFGKNQCPLIAIWSMRLVYIHRVHFDDQGNASIVGSTIYTLENDLTHFVFAAPLKMSKNLRSQRAVVVTSDGSVFVVSI